MGGTNAEVVQEAAHDMKKLDIAENETTQVSLLLHSFTKVPFDVTCCSLVFSLFPYVWVFKLQHLVHAFYESH